MSEVGGLGVVRGGLSRSLEMDFSGCRSLRHNRFGGYREEDSGCSRTQPRVLFHWVSPDTLSVVTMKTLSFCSKESVNGKDLV